MTRTWKPANNHSWLSGMRPCRRKIAISRGFVVGGADTGKGPGIIPGNLSDIVSFPTCGHSESRPRVSISSCLQTL